jgi:glycosyltransferase involved in cell wall biosynthesis
MRHARGSSRDAATDRPAVSVIVPAHNAAETLREQLDALRHQTYDGSREIVIVDNRSTDHTRSVAEELQDVERPARPRTLR